MIIKFKLHYWPIFTSLWLCFTFITSYAVAVANGHVAALFPYISDTGTTPPESCIFGQMLNLGALFVIITMYIRFRVVQICEHDGNDVNYRKWNNWAMFFGSLSAFGISIVANFQETSVLTVHFIGAFLAFGIGAIYFIIQTYLTWLSHASPYVKFGRIFLSASIIPAYISTMIFSTLAFKELIGDKFKWDPGDPGYDYHLGGTFSEWIMAIIMSLYIITFSIEFKLLQFDEIAFIQSKYV